MVYHFRVILFESVKMQIEVETEAMHTFLDLHNVLQSSLGIPPCQMASFFVSDPMGRKKLEVSQVEMGQEKVSCRFMRKTRIGDMISADKPFIFYTFDFFNDRSLVMELTGINMEKNLREPMVRINGIESQVHLIEEIMGDEFTTRNEQQASSPGYGVVEDYYEIFGDIEELTV